MKKIYSIYNSENWSVGNLTESSNLKYRVVGVLFIQLKLLFCEECDDSSGSINDGSILDHLNDHQILKKSLV